MTEATSNQDRERGMAPAQRTHIESIRREIDRVFDRFHLGTFPLRPPGVRANCPGANAVPDEVNQDDLARGASICG
jgi:hypothetical protein